MVKKLLYLLLITGTLVVNAQYHSVKFPRTSPKVSETQRLGITDITVNYHSPAVRGRDVWNDVILAYNDPNLPWRAGANMNTTIAFSTDVMINGNSLPAGSYGFHVITRKNGPYTLLFAHHDNQWGSYYLDKEKDVTLSVDVTPTETVFSEQLDYRFVDRTENSLVLAVDWAEKRIPFTVSVDLNKTVVENFRYELLGENTYRWQAWNDAANWCLERNTNLEEALEWADRSIRGGYNGFTANKNFSNMSTKANILWALGREKESNDTYAEAITLLDNPDDAYGVGMSLTRNGRAELGLQIFEAAVRDFSDQWYVHLGYGRTLYAAGQQSKGIKVLEKIDNVPESRKDLVQGMIAKMKNGEEVN